MCDGFLIDMKFYANLFEPSWEMPKMGLGNAGYPDREHDIDFRVQANVFGEYTDPYLLAKGEENPHKLVLTMDGSTYPVDAPNSEMDTVVIPIHFHLDSYYIDYYAAPEIDMIKSENLLDYCPKSCPEDQVEDRVCHSPAAAPASGCAASSHCAATGLTTKPTSPAPQPGPSQPAAGAGNQDAEQTMKVVYDIGKKMLGALLILL